MKRLGIAICATIVLLIGISGCGSGNAVGATQGKAAQIYALESLHRVVYASDSPQDQYSEYELDGSGNVIKVVSRSVKDGKEEVGNTREYKGFSPEGYPSSVEYNASGKVLEYSYKMEDGRAIEAVLSLGKDDEITTYTYYANGDIKTKSTREGDNYSTEEYDERGYITKSIQDYSKSPYTITYNWSFDSNGNPTSYVSTMAFKDSSKVIEDEKTVQCDENGNISRIYDIKGQLMAEYTYRVIEAPSPCASLNSHLKPF